MQPRLDVTWINIDRYCIQHIDDEGITQIKFVNINTPNTSSLRVRSRVCIVIMIVL